MYLKSKKLNPEDFQYSEEEQAKMAQAPPQALPQVEAAKIRAASDERVAQLELQNDAQNTQVSATLGLHELELKKQLAMLEYANREKISVNEVKAQLAKTVMELNVQRELNASDNAREMARPKDMEPPVQAPGRAGDGNAFEQTP